MISSTSPFQIYFAAYAKVNMPLQSDLSLQQGANLILLSMVDILEDPVQVHCPEGNKQTTRYFKRW